MEEALDLSFDRLLMMMTDDDDDNPIALWPWGRLSLNRNEYREHFLGVKAVGA